jgi:hypothetical protein
MSSHVDSMTNSVLPEATRGRWYNSDHFDPEHLDAGADHVCLQVLGPPGTATLPRQAWRELACALELPT